MQILIPQQIITPPPPPPSPHTHTHTHTHWNPTEIVENDDVIEVGGQVFHKPFVEKPVSAEDHNIYIYFPSDYGGGSQRLFRKVSIMDVLNTKHFASINQVLSYQVIDTHVFILFADKFAT